MGNYYYWVASLPFLQFGQEVPFSFETLLESGFRWLASGDWNWLKKARMDDYSEVAGLGHPVLNELKMYERDLRTELVKIRASRLGISPEPFLKFPFQVGKVNPNQVRDILKLDSPLEVELGLYRLRWEFCEQFSPYHHYDMGAVLLYAVKLQICEKVQAFQFEKGQTVFDSIDEGNIHEKFGYR